MPAETEFRPQWAPHVVGTFAPPEFDRVRGVYEDLKVKLYCESCGGRAVATCNSGQPREHVNKFALVHLHRDPLKVPPPKAPGMP